MPNKFKRKDMDKVLERRAKTRKKRLVMLRLNALNMLIGDGNTYRCHERWIYKDRTNSKLKLKDEDKIVIRGEERRNLFLPKQVPSAPEKKFSKRLVRCVFMENALRLLKLCGQEKLCFITISYRNKMNNHQLTQKFNRIRIGVLRKISPDHRWIVIRSFQKRGAPHLHILLDCGRNLSDPQERELLHAQLDTPCVKNNVGTLVAEPCYDFHGLCHYLALNNIMEGGKSRLNVPRYFGKFRIVSYGGKNWFVSPRDSQFNY